MIFFSDKYTDEIAKLRETLNVLGVDARVTVLEDEAFLPKGVFSPYEYYISRQNRKEHAERGLFYDALPVPEYWEVRDNGRNVGIYYMGRARAAVCFLESEIGAADFPASFENGLESKGIGSAMPTEKGDTVPIMAAENGCIVSTNASEKGVVRCVEWRAESGWTYRVDFYDKYGLKYASEFRGTDGSVESRVFYSDENQEVLVEQPGNDTVTLVEKGMVKTFFNSRKEFIEYYVAEVSKGEKRAIFVRDEKMLETLSVNSEGGQAWDYVCFLNEALLNRYREMGGKNGFRFYTIPKVYPENKNRGEALILTGCDSIEKMEELIAELPDMTFHIAAPTLMSDKLNRLDEWENVHLYPCVSQEQLQKLWERCDFYFDINHLWETYDAVNMAHQNNLLIMGFENTLHHPELLVKGCRFSEQDYKKMVLVVQYAMRSPELMQKLLLVQQRKKEEMWRGILNEFTQNIG